MAPETTEKNASSIQRFLPWIVSAGILFLHFITLNGWVTFGSLLNVSKVAGWEESSVLPNAVLYLVTLPFRVLPGNMVPGVLNAVGAVAGFLTLVVLARSVALLPHDRTREQRQRNRTQKQLLDAPLAWLPPALAVLVCGLQLTFWENATAFTGETVHLLFFAFLILCLLEYRVSREIRWLHAFAFVYGLGTTSNHALIGFFPFFLIAVIWIRGRAFFEFQFMSRMIVFGLLGLAFYLFIPALQAMQGVNDSTFWELLRTQFGAQKGIVFFGPLRSRALILSLASLVPLLFIGIRWPSSFGDMSAAGSYITHLMFRVLHAAILGICLYVAFDPPFSPRELGFGLPFLTYYYLGAISIGYCAGYFLQVCGREPEKKWRKRTPMAKLIDKGFVALMVLILIGVPGSLAARNWSLVKDANGPALRDFANAAASELPDEPTYVIADDAERLALIRAAVATGENPDPGHIFIDTRFFRWTYYHERMKKIHGDRWFAQDLSEMPPTFDSSAMMGALAALHEKGPVYYGHPSFGEFFEVFYQVPKGLIFELRKFDSVDYIAPELTEAEMTSNTAFWESANPVKSAAFMSALRNGVNDAERIAGFYSQSLNAWGTHLQKSDRLDEANQFFTDALVANPENVSAQINIAYNEKLASGDPLPIELTDEIQSAIGDYRDNHTRLMRENGPIDEPSFCFYLGRVYKKTGLVRQAAQQFKRVATLTPDVVEATMLLAEVLIERGFFTDAIGMLEQARSTQSDQLTIETRADMDRLTARALFRRDRPTGDYSEAIAMLEKLASEFPDSPASLFMLAQFHVEASRLDEALATADRALERFPNNKRVLLLKSAVLLSQGQASTDAMVSEQKANEALDVLNKILEIDPKESLALLNRGLSFARLGRWEESYSDYKKVDELTPKRLSIVIKLGEVAEKLGRRDDAFEHYRAALKLTAENSTERAQVQGLIDSLNQRQ